jgi:hypothetical protein
MPKKTECGQGPDRGEAADRLARWAGALSEAEMALAGGEPQEAERRAKAISAIVRAEADIAQWREQTLGPAQAEETELDGEAFRRALELRIDRHRREQGLDPLFEGDPEPA